MDLSNWMGKLPESLLNVPLTLLSIPGSHDSFSYTLSPEAEIGPEDRRLQCFDHCLCFNQRIKRIIFHWSLTQTLSCVQQLENGIRYFDFRLAAKLGTLTPFIIHGMYGASAIDILKEIHSFLTRHPREIVILDFQHFYNFTDEMHSYALDEINRIFGSMLFHFRPGLVDLSLRGLWERKYQVLVFYRNSFGERNAPFVWPALWMPNPWPNTFKPRKMISILNSNYEKGRDSKFFYVTQGVLTPDFTYIFLRLASNLEKSLATKSNRALTEWLKDKSAGENGINIVMADFVGMKPYDFPATIINLNYKFAKRIIRDV